MEKIFEDINNVYGYIFDFIEIRDGITSIISMMIVKSPKDRADVSEMLNTVFAT
jgi:hypothetical protein